MYGVGISREGEIIEIAGSPRASSTSSGSWYAYKASVSGQGKDNVRTFLQQNKAISREIEDQVQPERCQAEASARNGERCCP